MNRKSQTWYQRRSSALLLFVVALGVAYGLGSLAISSGSLGQYFLVIVSFIFAFNRLGHAVLPRRGS
jgi:hypothetical protein